MSGRQTTPDSTSDSDAILLQIDTVCSQFESEWKPETAINDVATKLDAFIPAHARKQLFRELVATDCELRSRQQLDPIPDQFTKTFPQYASTVATAVLHLHCLI